MTELNLKCHYQMVKTFLDGIEEVSVHEAFSTEGGVLYMMCPIPVYVVGETKEDISELASMIETDIERYGVIDYLDVQAQFDKYSEYTDIDPLMLEIEYLDEEDPIDDDYVDKNDKVLDLVQFMESKKRK